MYRLIIVDDEFEIRNGLSRYFPWESVGFEVAAVFENVRGALDYIRRNPVDVVLTDIEMPGMSGIELARVIHEQRLPVKVIFLSAYKKFEYARDAISYRVVHYITKPTVHSEIFEVFCSTLVVCTVTALVILVSGAYDPEAALAQLQTGVVPDAAMGVPLTARAFSSVLGPAGTWAVSLSLILFAFSSILGWSCYGQQSLRFLTGGDRLLPTYRAVFLLCTVLASRRTSSAKSC